MIWFCILSVLIFGNEHRKTFQYHGKDVFIDVNEIKHKELFVINKDKKVIPYYNVCLTYLEFVFRIILSFFEIIYLVFYFLNKNYVFILSLLICIVLTLLFIVLILFYKRFPKILEKKYPYTKDMVYKDCIKD